VHARIGRFEYIGVWEVTAGADNLGHVHAHVVVSWPWIDWGVLRELWLRCCESSERITFVAARRDGQPTSPQSAAKYLSKYVSKGVQTADFSPELRADVVAASYNTRWLFTSRAVWVPFVPCCPNCGQSIVLARYRFHAGNWRPDREPDTPRGSEQLALALPSPHERASCGCSRCVLAR
jgi:hypothetical protein